MTIQERLAKTVELRNEMYALWNATHPAHVSVHNVPSELFHQLDPVQISWAQRASGEWYHCFVDSVGSIMLFCEDACTVQPPTKSDSDANAS